MTEKLTIYYKPTCSKCRAALDILNESNEVFDRVDYYESPLTVAALRELVQKLAIPARGLLRQNELLAKGTESMDDEALLRLMAEHPDLIQRPIVVRGNRAILGRPPENIKRLLD
ncbi:MAG: ArsC/Spx/MgsR family protein [Nitrosomonas sp.]|nr:ArsC/Spx/MgsR family protein [Nitrosomonas sp.]